MDDIIQFTTLTQSILTVGAGALVILLIASAIWYYLRKRKTGSEKSRFRSTIVGVLIGVVVLAVTVTGGVYLNNTSNNNTLREALENQDVSVTATEFETLKTGRTIEKGDDTVTLVPLDNKSQTYELVVLPKDTSVEEPEDIDDILTPEDSSN